MDSVRIITFGYDAKWKSNSEGSVSSHAKNLMAGLDRIRKEPAEVSFHRPEYF